MLIHIVKKLRYGDPTGSNTMPVALNDLPDTVKGSISQDETDPTFQDFWVDQLAVPIDSVEVQRGESTFNAQFYDFDYDMLEALKGGTSVAAVAGTSAAAWQNGVVYNTKKLAFQAETESGQYINFFNARLYVKITGNGGRDAKLMIQVHIKPLATEDRAGDWEIRNVDIPA